MGTNTLGFVSQETPFETTKKLLNAASDSKECFLLTLNPLWICRRHLQLHSEINRVGHNPGITSLTTSGAVWLNLFVGIQTLHVRWFQSSCNRKSKPFEICMYVCIYVYVCVYIFIYLFICLFIYLFMYLLICIYLYVFIYLFMYA